MLSIRADREGGRTLGGGDTTRDTRDGTDTSAQGQGDQPLALPFSLGLLAIFCCLSWRPAWSRDLTVSSRPCPLWLRGHCHGRKEGVADQKVQRSEVGVGSWWPWLGFAALALVSHLFSRPYVIWGGGNTLNCPDSSTQVQVRSYWCPTPSPPEAGQHQI